MNLNQALITVTCTEAEGLLRSGTITIDDADRMVAAAVHEITNALEKQPLQFHFAIAGARPWHDPE